MPTKPVENATLISDAEVRPSDPYLGVIESVSNPTGVFGFAPGSVQMMVPVVLNKRPPTIDVYPYGAPIVVPLRGYLRTEMATYSDLVERPPAFPSVWEGATWPNFGRGGSQIEGEQLTSTWAAPTWLAPTMNRLREVLQLAAGWDGYGAAEPRVDHAVDALIFLRRVMLPGTPLPAIVPLNDGGVQLEWHEGGLDFEVTFSSGVDRGFFLHERESGEEAEGTIEEGIEGLRRLMDRF